MAERIHRGIGVLLWRGLMVAVVLLAIYVSGARVLLGAMPRYSPQLVTELSRITESTITVQQLSGRMRSFSPEIEVTGLALRPRNARSDVLRLERATLRLDVWASLLALAPRFDAVELNQPKIEWYFDDQVTDDRPAGGVTFDDFSDLLQAFTRISVNDGELLLTRVVADGSEISVPLIAQMALSRVGSERRVQARLRSDEGLLVTVSGQGIGNPFDAQASQGEMHGTVQASKLGVIAQLFDIDLSGAGRINFWYQPLNGQPSWEIVGDVNDIDLRVGEEHFLFDGGAVNAALRRDETGWQFDLQDTRASAGEHAFTIPRLQVRAATAGWAVHLQDFDAGAAVHTLLEGGVFSGALERSLTTLAPSGVVERLEASLQPGVTFEQGWWLRANVRDATTLPLMGVPGLAGIDAYVQASPEGATAWIDSDGFSLDLPRVYEQAIDFDHVMGRLSARWGADTLFLEDGLLVAKAAEFDAAVQFAMDIPLTKAADLPLGMYLTVGLSEADVAVRQYFIPKTVKPELLDWLSTAIGPGTARDATFVWRGDLQRWDVPEQTMQLGLALDDAAIDFHPEWPGVEQLAGTVLLDDSRISVWSDRGQMLGSLARDTSVEVMARRSGTQLEVQTDISSDVGATLRLLRETPVAERAGGLLEDLSGAGELTAALHVAMDIDRVDDSLVVQLEGDLTDAALSSAALDLSADSLTGGLNFDLARGFESEALTGHALGTTIAVDIDPQLAGDAEDVVFAGRFSATPTASALTDWLQPPLQLPVQGDTAIAVEVLAGADTQITIRSDLEGLALELPAPVGKLPEEQSQLSVSFSLDDNAPLDFFWQGRVNGQLYRRGGTLVGGSFDLTPRDQPFLPPEPDITGGYYLMGRLATVDIEQWLGVIGDLQLPNAVTDSRADLSIEAMQIDEVSLGDVQLGPVSIDLTPFVGWEMLGINAEWLDAELALQHDGSNNALIINTLDLDRMPSFDTPESESDIMGPTERRDDIRPPDLKAPVDVVLANLAYQGKQLGAASFTLKSDGRELSLDGLSGRLANIFFNDSSSFRWRYEEGEHTSTLALDSELGDVGDTLDQLSSPRILETRRGTLTADLGWLDSPLNVGLGNINGTLSLQLRDGSFLPVSGQATGALRILTLLNLAGLVQRANINQLFEPGVAFDTAQGELQFGNGLLAIPGFEIEGSGGSFLFDSDIDLLTETIDGELVVTLPLASNIPWVAALAGGLPIAAGAYVLSQLFEDQVNSLSSGVYSVSGELGSPKVRFERIFDAKSTQSRERQQAAEAGR